MAPRKEKVKHVLCESVIPETAPHGSVFIAKDTQAVYWAAADGVVMNLTDVLNSVPAHTPPRHGRDGKDGVCICKNGADGKTIFGPKGERGEPGVGIQGAAGRDGRDGKDCQCVNVDADGRLSRIESQVAELRNIITNVANKSDAASAATLALLEARLADARRAIEQLSGKQTAFATAHKVEEQSAAISFLKNTVAEIQFKLNALLDANKKGQEYIKFLQAKTAARLGKQS